MLRVPKHSSPREGSLQGTYRDSLEELTLSHDDIHDDAALDLARVLPQLPRLKRVDLTRNYVSKRVMSTLREAMPQAELVGSDKHGVTP